MVLIRHSASLYDRYVAACERHGMCPNIDIHIAMSKVKSQAGVLKLYLEHHTEAEMIPLIEAVLLAENSELNAVDVVYNKEVTNGQMLLRVLRTLGSKLGHVDLKRTSFRRVTLRDLFHRGLQCQLLDLRFCRARKLDMIGQFPQLHTLILDFSMYLTSLAEGCFRFMPNLARISICETKIANLWTTCAALSKASSLIELRFQSCICCEGTGACSTMLMSNGPYRLSDESAHMKLMGNVWHMDTNPMAIYDVELGKSESSSTDDFVSITDDYIIEELFSDEDSTTLLQPVHTSGEDSSGDSDTEQDGQVLEAMSVEDDLYYHGDRDYDRQHAFYTLDAAREQGEPSAIEDYDASAYVPFESGDDERERYLIEMDSNSVCLEGKVALKRLPNGGSLEVTGASENTLSFRGISDAPTSVKTESESLREAERELQLQRGPLFLKRGRFHHSSCICYEKHYREFIVTKLPGLKVLDNRPVTPEEREKAEAVFKENFEMMPNNRHKAESIIEILKSREISSCVLPYPCKRRRMNVIGNGRSDIAFVRSACASKMASCAWPSCVPICKMKTSGLESKYRPRQFEYHPMDPSLMVFGTLHGEVVVINHESDKVVGYVQSNGSSHSILGLCWLNMDPNKLIAGSDDGSLQLYNVNRMRLAMPGRNNQGGNSGWNTGQARGNPAIYSYDSFDQLTSVHINCLDEYFLASGYSRHVGLYNLCTGKQIQVFKDLHEQHINVVKFAHHSPSLFATSSFDREIKMWDLRQKISRPLYTVRSAGGNVMVCFSRDDHYLLSSAVDNEVKQHFAVDGRFHLKFDIPPTSSSLNYTRSYYMNGRDYIITGSCEENVVRIYCAQTGRRLRDIALEGRGSKPSIYVQSLRGDPFRDFHFSVLAAYFHPHPKSEILKVNLLTSNVYRKVNDSSAQTKLPTGMGA